MGNLQNGSLHLLPRRSTCCAALYRHCCLLALLRALREEGSSMRNEDFVRRGGKVQCTWKASLFCILMMQCVYTRDCYYSWCVYGASVLEHVLIFTLLAWFCLHYSLEPCRAVLARVLKPCCAGMAQHSLSTVQLHLH